MSHGPGQPCGPLSPVGVNKNYKNKTEVETFDMCSQSCNVGGRIRYSEATLSYTISNVRY